MIQRIEISLSPSKIEDNNAILNALRKKIPSKQHLTGFEIVKRSLDARQSVIIYRLLIDVWLDEPKPETQFQNAFEKRNVENMPSVIIIGTGPSGLVAALQLIERGFKPVLLERGKKVNDRKKDVAILNRGVELNENSNWCFGEGGAGTYTDGKLYTRSNKRGDITRILRTFVQFGASSNILIDAHPHIGTDKLPAIVQNIREFIIDCGGVFYFDTKVVDIVIKNGKMESAIDQKGNRYSASSFILASGNSSTEIYHILNGKGVALEFKEFAMGVRIELPQILVNESQYRNLKQNPNLPPAEYHLATTVDNRGVFSFCMCPGGIVVPALTHKGQFVVNGMSNSRRNSEFANSGLVVAVTEKDVVKFENDGPLKGLSFQRFFEEKAWINNKYLKAPAQRVSDFLAQKTSVNLPCSTYNPGLESVNLSEILPEFIHQCLAEGLRQFNQKIKGISSSDAVLIGIESRTSSPVRIPRDRETCKHPQISNLFPCGEGAGYAGGITSSAIDGINCALHVK